jgi:hypothetical protein
MTAVAMSERADVALGAAASLASAGLASHAVPASTVVGAPLHGVATLAPSAPGRPTPTGTVTFAVYGPGDAACTGAPAFASTGPLDSGGVSATSTGFTPPRVGTYRVIASYSGDVTYAGASSSCSDPAGAAVVGRASPGVGMTEIRPASLALGGSFQDTATVGPAPAGADAPTGTLTIDLYGPADPSCVGPPLLSSTGVVGPAGTVTSGDYAPPALGTYRLVATYSGDANYDRLSSRCADPAGAVLVDKGLLPIAAGFAPPASAVGGRFHATATLDRPRAGTPGPTGRVTFAVYGPGHPTCAGPPAFTSVSPIDAAGGSAVSGEFTPPEAGTYHVTVTYSGDADYNASTSFCARPGAFVGKAPLRVAAVVTPTSIGLGAAFHAAALLGPAPSGVGAPRGAVEFRVYGPGRPGCSGAPLMASVGRIDASGRRSASRAFAPAAAGTYRVVASYAGDVRYQASASACPDPAAVLTVTRPAPPLAPPVAATGPVAAASPPAAPLRPRAQLAAPAVRLPGLHRAQPGVPRRGTARLGLARYDARSEPATVVGIAVTAFTLLALFARSGLGLTAQRRAHPAPTGGGSGGGSGGSSGGSGGASFDVDYEGLDVAYLGAAGGLALGDRSPTWRWPGTAVVDAASVTLPTRLAARSPLLARVVEDGAYLRSILGVLAILAPIAGLVLGVSAVNQTGGRALPPGTGLTIAIVVLGVMDAAAGFAAVAVFALGVLVLGGLDSAAAVRTLLGLAGLWFAVPVLAGASRPLRRDPPADAKERFDRAADFAIASLIGAWAVQKLVLALPGLSGYQLPIASRADQVALWALSALIVRMLGETIAAHLYPNRLVTVEPAVINEPGAVPRLGAAALRTAIFVFVAAVVVGPAWQLWVAGILFLVPQALAVYEERFPKSSALGRVLPTGLFELVLMLFLLTWLGALLISTHSKSLIADAFVVLAIPGALLSVLHHFGASADTPISWGRRLAGTAVLVAGVLQALGYIL